MTNLCTEERFLNDVKDHAMQVINDSDTHRHILFSNKGSSVYRFELITWPGYLCICGDCGSYVFSRLSDMFCFFRMDDNDFNKYPERKLNINPHYWRGKIESVDTNAGCEKYDEDLFIARVGDRFNQYWEDADDKKGKSKCWDAIKSDVLSQADQEYAAYTAVQSFNHGDFYFMDFFDGGGAERYTFRYIWCLYAIVYGIHLYDELKTAKNQLVGSK